jgi:capsid protein
MAPLEPGAIIGTPPGAEIDVVNPNDSSTGYKEAWKTRYLKVSAGLGVPYFLLTGDYSGHNDRTLRLAMIDFYRAVKKYRQIVNHQFNSKVWLDFLRAAEQAGWKPVAGKTREDYERVEWIGEPLAHIHPVQEENAATNAMRSGTKTLGEVLQERGSDLQTFIREKKRENELLDEAGIVLDSDPRRLDKAGGYQEGQSGPDEEIS